MLEDTLQTLIKARRVADTFVVSSDLPLLEFAKRFGANAVTEPSDSGVNAAVRRGLESSSAYANRMIIPADLPLLSVEDVRTPPMLAREGAKVVISPAEGFDGTNLLLLAEGAEMELHYDDDSFRKHFAEATSRGLPVAIYSSRGVGFDIDRPRDVHRFFRYGRPGSTLTFLGRTLRARQRAKQRRD